MGGDSEGDGGGSVGLCGGGVDGEEEVDDGGGRVVFVGGRTACERLTAITKAG